MLVFINLLLFTTVYCKTITVYPHAVILVGDNGNDKDLEHVSKKTEDLYRGRIKREIDVKKGADESYSISAKKDFELGDEKLIRASGNVNGLKSGQTYTDVNAEVEYRDKTGNSLGLLAEHEKAGNTKLSAQGHVNILTTLEKKLSADGFIEKEFSGSDVNTQYGGSLNFLKSDGSAASVSALHNSKDGDLLKAGGTLNLVKDHDKTVDLKGIWTRSSPLDGLGPVSDTYSGCLNYANRNGDSASLSASHLPNFGDKLSAAGKFNLFHNENHNLDALGKIERNFPLNTKIDNFNTYSGNLDYTYKDRLGLGLGVNHNGFNHRTDLSALGNLNLYRDRDTSFDFNGGVKKTFSPSFSSPMEPFFGFSFRKSFK